jgi:hypothetical protein
LTVPSVKLRSVYLKPANLSEARIPEESKSHERFLPPSIVKADVVDHAFATNLIKEIIEEFGHRTPCVTFALLVLQNLDVEHRSSAHSIKAMVTDFPDWFILVIEDQTKTILWIPRINHPFEPRFRLLFVHKLGASNRSHDFGIAPKQLDESHLFPLRWLEMDITHEDLHGR